MISCSGGGVARKDVLNVKNSIHLLCVLPATLTMAATDDPEKPWRRDRDKMLP